MTIAAGPFLIAAALLVVGGCAKTARPHDTATAIRTMGFPIGPTSVRVGGVVEVVIGMFAIVVGSRTSAVLVASSYLVFAAFVGVALLRASPIATCGCFGKADTPPSWVHVGINVAAFVAAAAVVAEPGVALADVLGPQPLAGVPFVLLMITGTAAALLALTALPRLLASARPAVGP